MAIAKIKSIEEKTYQGRVTGHSIILDNGIIGYLNDKDSDELKAGDSTEYILEVKKNKQGKDYNLLTIKRVSGSSSSAFVLQSMPSPTGSQPKYSSQRSIQDWKAQASIDAMGFMVEAVATGKIDWPQIEEKQRQACNILWNEIDEIFTSKG